MVATAVVYNCLQNSNVLSGGVGSGTGTGMAHSQLARSLERILEEAHQSGELILTNRKLKDFPKTGTKYNLVDTVMADLSRNRFCELPEEITSFSFLETLILYHNTIRSIPESVKHLTSLTYLDLRSNHLVLLPREICFLPLQVLLVSNNRLTALPDELGRMDRLTDLEASYNQLSLLPARIGELRSLRSLSLRSNHLMYLPRELTCLTLVSLDVSNNRVVSLPLEIRQMTTLVELNLENNPLTSPPASLCVRGLVHVFKFLETQGAKDDKSSRNGGNYDGCTTLRRTQRHNSNGCTLDSNRVPRHHVDSGYRTCNGFDKRWLHNMPNVKGKIDSPTRKITTTPPSLVSAELMDSSLDSSLNTIDDESISVTTSGAGEVELEVASKELFDGEFVTRCKIQSTTVQQISNTPVHQHSNLSNGSSPDQEDGLLDNYQHNIQGGKIDDKSFKTLGNIQTYREYKEALKQQRNLEVSSVYKFKDHPKIVYGLSETSSALNSSTASLNSEENETFFTGKDENNMPPTKSIMKIGSHGLTMLKGAINDMNKGNGSGDECVVLPKKPVQKVIPSRNTEVILSHASPKIKRDDIEKSIMSQNGNGNCIGYVKPRSPIKRLSGNLNVVSVNEIIATSSKITPIVGLKSSVSATNKLGTAKTHRTVTWNHDIPPEKLSFTMRREFDRQREETELMTQLRSIIETRLKMTLPEDIASALTDGVILCHLANYVRPRSVVSIHVPSPGISKLTMARCRRNVDNFLEACRKIGVDDELICSCADIVSPPDEGSNSNTQNNNETVSLLQEPKEYSSKIPNPSAVLKTVSALIAMDFNPHHQNIRNMQQKCKFKLQLRKREQEQCHQKLNPTHDCNFRRLYIMENEKKHSNMQEHMYEHQLIATCTKKQMQHGQNNSTFNLSTNCHFDVTVLRNGKSAVIDENNIDDVHGNDDFFHSHNINILEKHEVGKNVTNFFRHAKLKTFQKIKFNLVPTDETNNVDGYSDNNHCMLQTIVETESEVIEGGCGTYIIKERPMNNEELQLKVEYGTSDMIANKCKLIDVSTTQKKDCTKIDDCVANVSKRIEFFEHSIAGKSNIMPQRNITEIKSKSNNIFSIYHVEVNAQKPIKSESAEQDAASSFLLKHDSLVLTIILSCVFIVSFLLLVFFPLPG